MKILPRPDDEYRTQEEWINFFNTEKKPMISMPNVFQLVKENNTEAIESLGWCPEFYFLVFSKLL